MKKEFLVTVEFDMDELVNAYTQYGEDKDEVRKEMEELDCYELESHLAVGCHYEIKVKNL